MTIEKLEELLEAGEGFTIEYKQCVNGINNSVYETVCSFSNRYGGHILLGVQEVDHKGVVIGVNPNCIVDMKKNFVNMLNNPQKTICAWIWWAKPDRWQSIRTKSTHGKT